jgi:hypothetical protein
MFDVSRLFLNSLPWRDPHGQADIEARIVKHGAGAEPHHERLLQMHRAAGLDAHRGSGRSDGAARRESGQARRPRSGGDLRFEPCRRRIAGLPEALYIVEIAAWESDLRLHRLLVAREAALARHVIHGERRGLRRYLGSGVEKFGQPFDCASLNPHSSITDQ